MGQLSKIRKLCVHYVKTFIFEVLVNIFQSLRSSVRSGSFPSVLLPFTSKQLQLIAASCKMSFVTCFLSCIIKRLESGKNTMSERRNRPENLVRKGLIRCTLRTKIRMEVRFRQNFEGVCGVDNEYCVRVWTGFIWLKVGASCGLV